MDNYREWNDIEIICELLNLSIADLASQLAVTPDTITRWKNDQNEISLDHLDRLYNYAYAQGIRLNDIKAQLCREDLISNHHIILFHGAKKTIEGNVTIEKSRSNNDFGKGFYCGESLEQSATFVCGYPQSSLYIVEFDKTDLSEKQYYVDREWMLTIAYFRGRLKAYADHPMIVEMLKKVEAADYIVAPIADNKMFEIIDSFIDGEITDVQCQHCLSATYLGNQYVFKSEKAIRQLKLKIHCYLSEKEKLSYLISKQEDSRIGNDKVKIARKQYRGQGRYIEEILK